MALTESNMLALGTKMPYFKLIDTVSQNHFSSDDLKEGLPTVIMFICNHCPYVLHVNQAIVDLANDFIQQNVQFVAISSNDVVNYPQDGPEKMSEVAESLQYPFPYLYDETQNTAKDFDAACTPDFYLFDQESRLVYRGQMDDSRPGNGKPNDGADLRAAINAVLKHEYVNALQKPSAGCNIKWK